MKIIAVANQKGGMAKTTTTIALASWFAGQGYKVLVVDVDQQGHVAKLLGKPKGSGLFRWLVGEDPLSEVVIEARMGLDIVTSDKKTAKIGVWLVDMPQRERVVGEALMAAEGKYDLVFLDLAPGSDTLHISALAAADFVLVPVVLDYLGLDGTAEILKTVRGLGAFPSVTAPTVIGVLPTIYERKTNETDSNLRRLAELVGGPDLVLPPIPEDTKVREAASRGVTIWEYAPNSAAAVGYAANGIKATNSRKRVGGYLHLAEIVERVVR